MLLNEYLNARGTTVLDMLLKDNSNSIWLAVIVIAPVIMLLLPNFTKIKVGTVELDIQTPSAKSQIEPQIDIIRAKMPAEYPLQSFKAAIQYADISAAFQNTTVIMPSKYEPNHSLLCRIKMFLPSITS